MVEREPHDDVLQVRDESQEGPVRVDVTLIDEMLRLTPKQRLQQNDRMATLAVRLHSLFMTDLGPLDCLGAIEGGRAYDDLVPLSVEAEMDGHLLVLGLETIVELKRQSTEAKDRLLLPVLEETLKRRGR